MGAEGKLDVARAREPGLGIDSPTMPGIAVPTHRSQGSLSRGVNFRNCVRIECCPFAPGDYQIESRLWHLSECDLGR